ncbi:RNA 2',3'-cyclic phosphodiesterase [Puteibacter caeruleilacunae]|nr:RNA 2',3'-cyclic phosphodiesterase [Puteibacter caeruleilacunae]
MPKRTFIGIRVNPNDRLLNLLSELQQEFSSDKIKWSPVTNWHFTLKFLGNTTLQQEQLLIARLQNFVKSIKVFDYKIAGLGTFVRKRKPKVLYCNVLASDTLGKLQQNVEDICQQVGFDADQRNYNPHLTLGRIKHLESLDRFDRIIGLFEDQIWQTDVAKDVILFESRSTSKGPEYIPIDVFPLAQ